jgi:RNA polymerase-interacting CarD/CdnL/TRCF family regulator
MILSTKEKEKRVLEWLEQNKSYREIQDLFHISSRDISSIVKKAREKKDREEEKKIQTSITSKAYKLFTKGKGPLHVATRLGIEASEARKVYTDYLDLKGCHHLVEILQQFDRNTIRNFAKSYMTNDNRIDEQKIIEAIKISSSLPKIKEEYYNISSQIKNISSQLINLQNQRDHYNSENKLLITKNLILHDDLSIIRNKIKEHITELLKQKDRYIRLSIITILKIIKDDPEKGILINNNNLRSSDQKISEMVAKFYDTISGTIVDSITNPNKNIYDVYNNPGTEK